MKHKAKTKGELLAEISRLRKRVKNNRVITTKNVKPLLSPFAELHNLFFNSINDEIFVSEYQTKGEKPFRILEVNSVACSRLGYTREELLQKSIYDIYIPEMIPQVEEMMKKLLIQKISVWEGIHLTKNGSRIPVEVHSHIFKSDGRQAVISAVKDITFRRQVEDAKRQTEQAVRESEYRFRTLAEASFEGIALTENAIIVDLNDQLAKMYGYERKELIGKSLLDMIVPELRSRVKETIQSGKRDSFEILGLHKNGTIFSAEIRGRAAKMDGKELHISTIRDITERKKIEEALRNEKAFLDALMDNIPDSIFFKDRQCRIMRANRKEIQDLNFTDMRQIIGKTDEDLFGGEFARRTRISEQHLMESGEPVIGLVETRTLEDGKLNWTSTTKVPLRNNNGDIVGLVGITREINELMKAQEELQRERNLLRTIIDNIPDGIYVKDLEYRKTLANHADVYHMGCKSESEIIGKDDYELFPKEMAEGFIADDRSVIQTGTPVVNREEYVIDEEGRKHFLLTTKLPFRDKHNKIIGLIGIGRDITERKIAEMERERLIKSLQEALADVKTLSGLLPICANCKQIRDDKGFWMQVESYIQEHSQAQFSHGICPDCMKKLYPDFLLNEDE